MKRVIKAPPAKPMPSLPHPAGNLGVHLKRPTDGEIVTTHHKPVKR